MNAELSQKQRRFNVDEVRAEFPILNQAVNGHALVYLDNAATSQKPQAVIDALVHYYQCDNSNVHRGAHALADRATAAFENARASVASAINSPEAKQLIWTRGTTEAINLVAYSWGRANLKAGDEVLVSALEHHSNIVPWQLICEAVGAKLKAIPVSAKGELDLEAYQAMLSDKVKFVSVAHVSNALGSINPIEQMIALAHEVGALVLIDGAQGLAHFDVDVQALDCDFYAFSGHKVFGPTGIGGLWGKKALLESMPPWQGGGEMIETVSFDGTTFNQLPYKFEAGTPDIAGVIALGAAFNYLKQFDRRELLAHESELLAYCIEKSKAIDGLVRVGEAQHCASVFSFIVKGTHPADIGTLLDQQGVAVRTGHHCVQPLMQNFNIPGTVRASFSIYNSKADVDALFAALDKVLSFLR
ncbi:aminotransferase class V-fold PLP-dependent enzyme [Agaribacterium haliotis]|uniref:aminotransferase class V-fold PLP-dependent enzyme n=1 Tax=Agaribacterium haliotis TaxID=2013869 RepID=UPI000BB59EBC|nr:cysteine desulfurase [Agaribacterium haliotis]